MYQKFVTHFSDTIAHRFPQNNTVCILDQELWRQVKVGTDWKEA